MAYRRSYRSRRSRGFSRRRAGYGRPMMRRRRRRGRTFRSYRIARGGIRL